MIEKITRCILMVDDFVDRIEYDHPRLLELQQLVIDIKRIIEKKDEYYYLLPLLDLRLYQLKTK